MDEFKWRPIPKSSCVRCGGFGWHYARLPHDSEGHVAYEHPSFGKAIPCQASGCMAEQWNNRHVLRAQQEQEYGKPHTFESFSELSGTEKCLRCAKELVSPLSPLLWLLIYGGVGNGKTHLLHAIQHETAKQGGGAYYNTVASFMTDYWAAVQADRGADFIKQAQSYSFLILDDWKPEQGTDSQKARLEEILTYRYERRLPVAMATNRDVMELPERLRSRFLDREISRAVLNEGADYRVMVH